jgi:hypothetical protein
MTTPAPRTDSGGRAEAGIASTSDVNLPTAMTPPVLTNEHARDTIVGALLSPADVGAFIEPCNKGPQKVVSILDAEPEFKLRGY